MPPSLSIHYLISHNIWNGYFLFLVLEIKLSQVQVLMWLHAWLQHQRHFMVPIKSIWYVWNIPMLTRSLIPGPLWMLHTECLPLKGNHSPMELSLPSIEDAPHSCLQSKRQGRKTPPMCYSFHPSSIFLLYILKDKQFFNQTVYESWKVRTCYIWTYMKRGIK